MSCVSECSSSEVASFIEENSGEFQKGSRISYSTDYLLSLAVVDVAQELPSGFDRSILSELDDACKCAHEHQKISPLVSQNSGWTSSDSSLELSERWESCKFSSKDSKSSDSGKSSSCQSRRSWQNPGNYAILRSLPIPEQDGILGNWSASKLTSVGSEVKLQGTNNCLLSRCKEPYRPPSFNKAMLLSGTGKHETSSNEASGCAECPSKEQSVDKNWRKDVCKVSEEHSAVPEIISMKSPPPVSPIVSGSVESSCSAGEVSEECRSERSPEHQPLLQDPVVQPLRSKRQLNKVDPGVIVDAEKFQGNVLEGGRFSSRLNLEEAEDIDAYLLDEENLAPSDSSSDGQSVKEANMGYKVLEKKELGNHADYSAESKETQIEDSRHSDAMGKTASNPSAVDMSISSASSVGLSYRASSLLSASVCQDLKGFDAASKELHKANAPLTIDIDHSKAREKNYDAFTSEIWQSPVCTKNPCNIVKDRGSSSSDPRFTSQFTDNVKSDCVISCENDKEGRKCSGVYIGKSMVENVVGQEKPKGPSPHVQNSPFSKENKNGASDLSSHCALLNTSFTDGIIYQSLNVRKPKLDKTARNQEMRRASGEVCGFRSADETDSSLEFKLPDEDSLITIDDTYILKQDKPKPSREFFRGARGISPFLGSNKLIGSETVPQNWRSPDPWFHKSQINPWNTLDPALVNAPPTYYDPWKFHHNIYKPFTAAPPHHRQLTLKPQNFGQSVRKFVSPGTPHADDYCPDLDKILAAEPSIYHQLLQTPCHNQELDMFRSFPPNHHTNVKSTLDKGKRGFLAEERCRSIVSEYLQTQRKLAR